MRTRYQFSVIGTVPPGTPAYVLGVARSTRVVDGAVPLLTVMVNDCVTNRPPGSLTRTVTAWLPVCVDVGVQAIRPFVVLIVMPVGACVSE